MSYSYRDEGRPQRVADRNAVVIPSPDAEGLKMALHRAIASFVAREGHRPPGSNGLVVDLRQDRDQTNPGRQW